MTDLEAYIDFLVRLGFTGVSAGVLSRILYRSNLEPYTFMVEEIENIVYVHVSGVPSSDTYFTMEFKAGQLHGYGSHH